MSKRLTAVDRALFEAARARVPAALWHVGSAAFGVAYWATGGPYTDEITEWAEAAGVTFGQMALLQCSYELAQMDSRMGLGCTAGVARDRFGDLRHLRTLDWDLPELRPATHVLRKRRPGKGRSTYIVVGPRCFVGVLSGMLPGAYSITINYAPPSEWPGFGYSPPFLVRHVLETCDTYEEAVHVLSGTPLSAPVFFMVCGRETATVIERTRHGTSFRGLRGVRPLVQGNHWFDPRGYNGFNMSLAQDTYDDSVARVTGLESDLLRWVAARALLASPVANESTQQSMVFCPALGTTESW